MTFTSHHKRILASWGNPGAENETGKKRKKGKKAKNNPLVFSPFSRLRFVLRYRMIAISPECGRLSVVNNTQSRVILAARF
jgi:hypothetical protein